MKPSEVPYGIDQDLRYRCGSFIQFLDGPNNKVYFEAWGESADKVLQKMQDYLNRCNWEKVEDPSTHG